VSIEEILAGLARHIDGETTPCHDQAIRDFTAIYRRHDEDPRQRQRIREIAALIDAEDALYAQAVAALDRGDGDLAAVLLRQPAEAGIGEAAWLLGSVLEEKGDIAAAVGWYERAAEDGDSRALRKLGEIRCPGNGPGSQQAGHVRTANSRHLVRSLRGRVPCWSIAGHRRPHQP
jgi:TPR repeat protein